MSSFRVHCDEAGSRGLALERRPRLFANVQEARERLQRGQPSQGPFQRLHGENGTFFRAKHGAFGKVGNSGLTSAGHGTARDDQENLPPNRGLIHPRQNAPAAGKPFVGAFESRRSQGDHDRPIRSQPDRGNLPGVSQTVPIMKNGAIRGQFVGRDGRGRKREPRPIPGMVCYLHKDIDSCILRKQVSALDYKEILGHPVVVLAMSPRPGDIVFAKITTFGGKTLEERCGEGDIGERLRAQYLPIRDGNNEYSEDIPVLEVKGGRRFDRQSYVNVARRNILSVEAHHLPPFRKTTSTGVEFELEQCSLRAIVAHYDNMIEDEFLWPSDRP